MSFRIMADLVLFTLAVCSLIFSSISANSSWRGFTTSSVIFCCSMSWTWQVWDSFFQCSYSLFMDSISSVTKSMDLPRGLVDWQRTWIAFFMNSISYSVNAPPDWALSPIDFHAASFWTPEISFLAPAPPADVSAPFLAFLPSLPILIFGPLSSCYLGAESSSSSFMSFLASSTKAPPLPSNPDGSISSCYPWPPSSSSTPSSSSLMTLDLCCYCYCICYCYIIYCCCIICSCSIYCCYCICYSYSCYSIMSLCYSSSSACLCLFFFSSALFFLSAFS